MKLKKCLFCNIESNRIIIQNDLAFAIYDGYPVTEYHALIIPKRHVETYFDLNQSERENCYQLIEEIRGIVIELDSSIDGFNIGMNNGQSAGQTIFHCHIHLIPRRSGDVENPKGGVRGVIAGKQQY